MERSIELGDTPKMIYKTLLMMQADHSAFAQVMFLELSGGDKDKLMELMRVYGELRKKELSSMIDLLFSEFGKIDYESLFKKE